MSECAKCNGWGVDDVTGFACPSCPTVKQSLTVEPVSNPDELAVAMQADAAPVAWLKTWNSVGNARTNMKRVDLTPDCEDWLASMFPTITPLYAHQPVADRVSTSSPVDVGETGNTSSKLRPASVVAHEVCEEMEEYGPSFATKVIEADRQAVRAALVAKIVAWLRDDNMAWALIANSDQYAVAAAIEAGEWK